MWREPSTGGARYPACHLDGRAVWEDQEIRNSRALTDPPRAIIPLDDSAQRYEHVSGQLSESCNTIKWCYVELKQYVYMDAKPPRAARCCSAHQASQRCDQILPLDDMEGRTISTMHRKYRASKSRDAGADGEESRPSAEAVRRRPVRRGRITPPSCGIITRSPATSP